MAQIEGVLAKDLQTRISEARLLVVGAGGIGCELLKNIVLTGTVGASLRYMYCTLSESGRYPVPKKRTVRYVPVRRLEVLVPNLPT